MKTSKIETKSGQNVIQKFLSLSIILGFLFFLSSTFGIEATKHINEKYKETCPRIIALTESTMKKDVDKCFESGMNGILGKPIILSPLVKALWECKPLAKKKAV